MAFAPYATLTDLTNWMAQTAPVDPEGTRLLNRATDKIDAVLIGAVYAVDTNGMPTDPKAIAALRDAVCAQIEWWLEGGDELGELAGVGRYAMEGVMVMATGRGTGGVLATVAPRAWERLQIAGLVPALIIA